ncbi:hypothetical protein Hanom_Chr03g00267691 [Helianthus anomalus]
MKLTSRMKMARFQTFLIQVRKKKPLDENRKTGQTSGTEMAFYYLLKLESISFFFFLFYSPEPKKMPSLKFDLKISFRKCPVKPQSSTLVSKTPLNSI